MPRAAKKRLHAGELLGLHAEEEAVGRIGRRAAPPGVHQVVAREGEEQHRREAEREARHLDGVAARVTPEVREAVAQRGAARADAPCHRRGGDRAQRDPGHRGEYEHRHAEATDHGEPEARIARLPHQQSGERGDAGRVHGHGAGARRRPLRAGSRAPRARSSVARAAAARSRGAAPAPRGIPAAPAARRARGATRAAGRPARRQSRPAPHSR